MAFWSFDCGRFFLFIVIGIVGRGGIERIFLVRIVGRGFFGVRVRFVCRQMFSFGVGGGVGCASRFGSRVSGVMVLFGAVATFGVVGLLVVSEKDNLVCRTIFEVVSFPEVILDCLVFSPRLGEGLLPLAPLGLRRFGCRVMVDGSRGFGTRSCVGGFAVPCRCHVELVLVRRIVLFSVLWFSRVILANLYNE